MYKPNREHWVIEMRVDTILDALDDKPVRSPHDAAQIKLWKSFLYFMEPDRKLFLQYDDYVFFFGE